MRSIFSSPDFRQRYLISSVELGLNLYIISNTLTIGFFLTPMFKKIRPKPKLFSRPPIRIGLPENSGRSEKILRYLILLFWQLLSPPLAFLNRDRRRKFQFSEIFWPDKTPRARFRFRHRAQYPRPRIQMGCDQENSPFPF